MKYIDSEKLIAEIERRKKQDITFRERSILIDIETAITSLQQEQKCIFGNIPSEDICLVCSAACPLRVPKTKVSTSTEIAVPSGQADELTFEEYLRGCFEINNGIENDTDNLVRIHAPELLKLARKQEREGLHFTPLNRLIQKIPSKKWNDTVNNYAKKLRDCLIKEGYLKDAEILQGYISYMNGNNVPMATMDGQEQPEVDLEKEIDRVFFQKDCGSDRLYHKEIANIARHFYELGLNARKEE